MSQTILEKLLNGAEVEWKTLGEVCNLKRGRVISKQYLAERSGRYPVYSSQTANQGKIGTLDTYDFDGEFINWTTDGANAGTVFYRNGKFSLTNVSGLINVINNSILNCKYLFYWLTIEAKCHVYTGMGNPKLMSHQVKAIPIPIPPLSVQKEIVRILDAFTAHTAELTAELNERKKQYNYYRDKLLTFSDDEVEWKPLGEVGELIRGNGLQKKDLIESGVPAIHYGQIYTYYGLFAETTKSYVSHDLAKRLKKAQCGDILIAGTSENVEDVMKPVGWLGGSIVFSGDMFVFRPNYDVDTKYLTYLLTTKYFFDYKKKYVKGTKVIRMNTEKFLEFLVPIPPLSVQKEIVGILDSFSTLTTSISEGLPREIELRNKQYEYYRDQLLNFPKPGNDAIKHNSTNR